MLKNMSKGLSVLLVLCLFMVMLAGCGPTETAGDDDDEQPGGDGKVTFITVATGAAAWGTIGAKIADVISKDVPGVEASSIPGGGIENMKKIQDGEAQFGMTDGPLAGWAVEGKPPFEGQTMTKARHVINLYKGIFQAVAPNDSGLNEWDDLKTKPFRVNMNKEGMWGNYGLKMVMDAYGVNEQDILDAGGVINKLGYDDAKIMMQDGLMDLWATCDGVVPHASVMELFQNPGVHFLEIKPEIQKKLEETVPGIGASIIPKGSYPNQDEDANSVELWILLFASEDVPDEIVYEVTKALVNRTEELQSLFVGAEAFSLENALENAAIPLHPGAQKYYEERGLIK